GIDLDVHVRVGFAETRKPRNEQLAREERRQLHPQKTPPVAAREAGETLTERIQQRGDFAVQSVSGGRQLERSRLAVEQPHTESLLQLFHLVTDRGRRQKQLVRSDLEAAVTCGRAERAEIA